MNSDNLTQELNSKLDDLFDEDTLETGEAVEEAKPQTAEPVEEVQSKPEKSTEDVMVLSDSDKLDTKPKDFPLDNLNAILLSLDWEITDELISSYLAEIDHLKSKFSSDKYSDYFLRILDNLGRYIKKNQGASHPESITMMQSIHQGFESIFLNSDMTEAQKKKVFYKEYSQYTKFKQKVSSKKAGKPVKVKPSAETEKFAEVFISKISESLRQVVKEEIEKLKSELMDSINK